MVRVRMTRKGASKIAFFRIVVADGRSPRDGRFIEQIGWYDPKANPAKSQVNLERYKYWVARGALPTDTVAQVVRRFEKSAVAKVGQAAG